MQDDRLQAETPTITKEVNVKKIPTKIRVTMTYDRTMNADRFWDWVDLTMFQINQGRQKRMVELGQLTYEPVTRDCFLNLIKEGHLKLHDNLGHFGYLDTVFTYAVLEERDEDERDRIIKLPES